MLERWTPQLLSVLRIVSALDFLEHGAQKLLGFPPSAMPRPVPMSLTWFAGIFELGGGLLLLVGLATRPVAFLLAGEMAVAIGPFTPKRASSPRSTAETRRSSFASSFSLSAAGPGPWSIDAVRRRAPPQGPAAN
jgi:putative oxidoreductase